MRAGDQRANDGGRGTPVKARGRWIRLAGLAPRNAADDGLKALLRWLVGQLLVGGLLGPALCGGRQRGPRRMKRCRLKTALEEVEGSSARDWRQRGAGVVLGLRGRGPFARPRTRLLVEGGPSASRGERCNASSPITEDGEDPEDRHRCKVRVALKGPRPGGEASVVVEALVPDPVAGGSMETKVSHGFPVVAAVGPLLFTPLFAALLLGVSTRVAGGA